MVYESGHVPISCGINDVIMVHSKEITAANSSGLIPSFPFIRHSLSNDLPHILYYHLVCCYVLYGKETPVVNGGLGKLEKFLPCLKEGIITLDCDHIR